MLVHRVDTTQVVVANSHAAYISAKLTKGNKVYLSGVASLLQVKNISPTPKSWASSFQTVMQVNNMCEGHSHGDPY